MTSENQSIPDSPHESREPYSFRAPVIPRSFATQAGLTHVRLQSIVNYGGPEYTGLSEIRFGAIPEPSALLLSVADQAPVSAKRPI